MICIYVSEQRISIFNPKQEYMRCLSGRDEYYLIMIICVCIYKKIDEEIKLLGLLEQFCKLIGMFSGSFNFKRYLKKTKKNL